MRKIITIIAVIMMAFAGFAEGNGKIQRVLYEHRDYKVVLRMDPSNIGGKCTEEDTKAAIMTMKSMALAAGWDGWYKGWSVKFTKDSSRNSKIYSMYQDRNKCVAAENGKFMDRLFEYIMPEDIAEAQKALDSGYTYVEILVFNTGYENVPLTGILQMYNNDFWLGAWSY